MFEKYQHIVRFGRDEVEGIEKGTTYVFPKLDGTNSSVWIEDGVIKAGSRNKELSETDDNRGFYKKITQDKNIIDFLNDFPDFRLYGEYLVPHTIKSYNDSAWKEFYVFDVIDSETGEYLTYGEYEDLLERYDIKYIPLIAELRDASQEDYLKLLPKANYLVKDGSGEGIVIKNYDYVNKYGRVTWAKIITNEFLTKKEIKHKTPSTDDIEEKIINQFCTESLISKEKAKLINEGVDLHKNIPRLLETIYRCIITEEMWDILKKFKRCAIDFNKLKSYCDKKVKEYSSEIFG